MLNEWVNLQIWQTKKSQQQYEERQIYTFIVNPQATCLQIKQALKEIFPDVKVKEVRTSLKKPVLQKTSLLRKMNRNIFTKKKKKAFVELYPGYKLPFTYK